MHGWVKGVEFMSKLYGVCSPGISHEKVQLLITVNFTIRIYSLPEENITTRDFLGQLMALCNKGCPHICLRPR